MAKTETKKKNVTKKHLAKKQREEKQTRIILIAAIVIGVIIVGLVGYGLVDQLLVRPATPVAEVGDQVITAKAFESRVKYTRVQLLSQVEYYYSIYQMFGEDFGASYLSAAQNLGYQLLQPEALGSDILDEMIDDILIHEEAAARGITVSEDEINEAVYSAFGFYPDGTATPTQTATVVVTPTYSDEMLALVPSTSTPTATEEPTETPEVTVTPSEESTESGATDEGTDAEVTPTPELSPTLTLTPTITLTPTPYTTEVFADNVKEFDDNYGLYDFSYEDLRGIFEVQLLREKLVEEITVDMVPVEEQVWARHILVDTEEEAQDILQKLEEGEEWNALAAEYSLDDSNKDNGGDLGWFSYDDMVEAFAEAAFSLDEGEISEPVESDYGFHIVQLVGKRESQISAADFQNDKDAAFNEWLTVKRNARNDIVIHDGWEEFVPVVPELPTEYQTALFYS